MHVLVEPNTKNEQGVYIIEMAYSVHPFRVARTE